MFAKVGSSLFNLDQIALIEKEKGYNAGYSSGNDRWLVHFTGGGTHILDEGEQKDLVRAIRARMESATVTKTWPNE